MGFISSTLNQPEQWRVWSNIGLEFILAEPGSELRIFWDNAKQHSQEKQNFQSQKTGAKQMPQASQPAKVAEAVGTTKVAPKDQSTALNATRAKTANTPAFPQAQSPDQVLKQAKKALLPPSPSPTLLENLPEPWATFASKSKPGRPLLWTYQELALDLSGKGDPARANIIKKIITTLKLPAGSSNFWPHSIPEQTSQGHEFKQKLDFFEQGFNALEAQFLLVFGKPSVEAIIPGTNCLPYSYTNYDNKVLIYLPSLEELEDGKKLKKSVDFLQIFTLPCFGGGS